MQARAPVISFAALAAVMMLLGGSGAAAPEFRAADQDAALPSLATPGGGYPSPPEARRFAMPPGTQPGSSSRGELRPRLSPVEQPSAGGPAPAPQNAGTIQPEPEHRLLDDLFGRLARSTDKLESQGIAGAIERVWMRSGSDTADLLMGRALAAMQGKDLQLAETLLTQVIKVEPDWAEAWNKRATVRFEQNDDAGAMQDIAQVLVREPRHFGALSGMGVILQRAGLRKDALKAFREALKVYPELDDIRTMVDKLTIEVEGRDI